MKFFKSQHLLFFIITAVFLFTLLPHSVLADSLPVPSTKTIFLTFDGDMNPSMKKEQELGKVKQWYDPALISYLEKNNIPSTFFVTGMFAEMYPDLIKSLADNPNFSIQNHSYSHPAFEPNCYHLSFIATDQEKKIEIIKAQNAIKSLTGKSPAYFRYPGLCHNPLDDAIVKEEGLSLVQGQFGSGDAWMKKVKSIVQNVLKGIKTNNVIVFHLGSKLTPKTTMVVEKLFPKLEKLGYTFEHL
jgi:peptidoglycan/xylan/chitin deacetylase (PgdA/CDA1 family)